MRYTALSTTSSTSFCGQHVQLRCFCIGLANCYVAGTEPHRRSAGGFRTAFPAQDCNVAARAVLGGLHHEYRWERIAACRTERSQRTLRLDCVSPISNACTGGKACDYRLRRDERVGVRTLWFLFDPSSPARARIL